MSEELNLSRAHGARIYDYVLGGKDNFALDREAAEAAMQAWPGLRTSMRSNRAFMQRVGRFLASECGIRQFLDIGTGIPTSPNLHEVVQGIAPEARIVYTDNDPVVLAHARALMTSTPEGRTAYIHADMRDPAAIIGAPRLHDTLDLDQPVALLAIAVLHFIEDDDDALSVMGQLVDVLPSGSYLAVSTGTADFDPEPLAGLVDAYQARGEVMRLRNRVQVEQYFDGLELLEPGVVQVHKWRPDDLATGLVKKETDVAMYCGVAQKT